MPYLSSYQARLRDDIRGLIKGEVRCDDMTLQLYSTDASILQCRPQGVVWPQEIEDVVAVVRYASEKGIPIHVRGVGTGTAGESLGSGLILDLTRFMRRILSLDHDAVTVQPGIIHKRLNHTLQKIQRRCFGPVSGFSPATTIGSILSRNGAGANWLRYGFPSDQLLALKLVTAKGNLLTLDRNQLPRALETSENNETRRVLDPPLSKRQHDVARGIALARSVLLGEEHALADEVFRVLSSHSSDGDSFHRFPPVNRAGYCCHDILRGTNGNQVDLARLVAGSEGTLGVIVEARLRTTSLPNRAAAGVLFFSSLEKATKAIEPILDFSPVLCELLDRRRLSMIREEFSRYQDFLPIEAEAVLMVELDAGTINSPIPSEEVLHRLTRLIETLRDRERLCYDALRVENPNEFLRFDQLNHCAKLILFRMRRSMQPLPLFDDPAVPVKNLPAFLPDLLGLLRRHEVTASLSGHVGQGHLQISPIVDLSRNDLTKKLCRLAEEVYSLVRRHDGTISSEGGTGLLKSQFIPDQFSGDMPLLRNIKETFDPNDLFNPGKVVPGILPWHRFLRSGLAFRGMDHPQSRLQSRQESESSGEPSFLPAAPPFDESDSKTDGREKQLSDQLELQLKWEPQRIFESTYLCNGCGDCFRLQPDRTNRMCPLFRRYLDENASPRAKANLLRGVLENDLPLHTLTTEKAKQVADLCFHCQMCGLECPAEVDISQLAFRCKSAYVAAHGMPLEDLFFSRIDKVLQWSTMLSCPVNWMLSNASARWLLEKILQIPQSRFFPKLTKVSFLGRTHWSSRRSRPKAQSKTRVALFVDVYANYFDPRLADLAAQILEHNGLDVYVPLRQRASGLTAFAAGNMDRAERLARHNTLLLADLIRQGYQIVTLEPASASCITREYRYVVDDIDTALVISNVVDYCDFLFQLHRRGELNLDFKPIPGEVGYHAPCRSISNTTRRVDAPTPAEQLLGLIPELQVRRIEQGCCGLAGTYGLKKKNHRRSLQIGLPLFRELRGTGIDFGATDCCACKMQMEHGVEEKPTLHPIRFLAAAYGLTSELEE